MGVVALLCLALLQEAPAAEALPEPAPLPALTPVSAVPSTGSGQAPEPAPEAPKALKPEPARTESRRLSDARPEAGPNLGGFMIWTFVVIGLLGGLFLVLRRFAKGSRFLGGGGLIQVLGRKSLGPRQDLFLVEVGSRVFMIGATRDRLSTLGEFAKEEEVAALRSGQPQRNAFRDSLKEGLKEAERPLRTPAPEPVPAAAGEEAAYESLAGELAELRKTVRSWRG